MKKVILLIFVGLLSFAAGLAGIYLAMPSIAPEKVDSVRVHLDTLGLLRSNPDEALNLASLPDSLLPDTLVSPDSTAIETSLPKPQDIIQALRDSLFVVSNIVQDLSADTSSLAAHIRELEIELQALTAEQADAAEVGKTLAKLDDDQLGGILDGLHLTTIEMLYQQSTARERTRLLQSMSPARAAEFVRTLVGGPAPAKEVASTEPAPDGSPGNDGEETTLK